MNKPIRRHESLQPLSRDHHLGLLLCWKINRGFEKGVDPVRIKKYTDWFYKNHLVPHFKMEELYIFPVLGNDNELITQAITEHRQLENLFEDTGDPTVSLPKIESALEQHIRFEERVLFNVIQENATPEQFQVIKEIHQEENYCENLEDPFWI